MKAPKNIDWIINWIKTERIQRRMYEERNAPSLDDLYAKFEKDNVDEKDRWDHKQFKKALWNYCDMQDGIKINPHKKGKTVSARRWLKGKFKQQKEHILIITDNDDKLEKKVLEAWRKKMKEQEMTDEQLTAHFEELFARQEKEEKDLSKEMKFSDEDVKGLKKFNKFSKYKIKDFK
jgi:chorismate mutase